MVGYTNAGKSTIMNRMVDSYGESREKTVLEKDMLFATLETNVRTINTGDNQPFFLVDTVGFIHKLPHSLVKAFQSTLEEVKYADLLVQVVDFSDPHYKQHMEVTEETLKELGAGDIPQIIVLNKADQCESDVFPRRSDNRIYIAAGKGIGIDELVDMIKEYTYVNQVVTSFMIPYDKGSVVSFLCENSVVLEQSYFENGVYMKTKCQKQDVDRFCKYICKDQ